MKMTGKYVLRFAGVCAILGIVLIGVGIMLGGSTSINKRVANTNWKIQVGLRGLNFEHDYDFNSGNHGSSDGESTASEKKLESFTQIDASLVSEDITIEYGSDYSIKITGDPQVVEFQVKGDSLNINRRKNFSIGVGSKGASIVVTVPSGAKINKCDVGTVSAGVDVKIDVTELEIDTTSGKITADGSFVSIGADSTSGNVIVEGDFKNCSAESTSGKVDITSSGARDDYQIALSTVSGSLRVDGEKISGREVNLGNGNNEIDVDTVSGNISIAFKK